MRTLHIPLLAFGLSAACRPTVITPPPGEPRHAVPSPGRASGPPDRFEVYAALLAESALALAHAESCDGVVGHDLRREATLGDWIAWNLTVLGEGAGEGEGSIALPVACHAAQDGPGEWECDVGFQVGQGGESPWSWGVRARFRDADASLVVATLTCTGAG